MEETSPPHLLAKRQDFALGKAMVRPSLRKIEGPLGETKGEPRVIQVLLALADAQGAVLSRDDLLRICWDRRTVGDDAINRAIAEVRRIASAVGGGFEVETVARVGYRIVGVDWGATNSADRSSRPRRKFARRQIFAGGVAALGLAAVGSAAIIHRQRSIKIDALIERGRLLQVSEREADVIEAEALFRQAITVDAARADAWGWLAVVLGDQDKARDAAQRALSLDPHEPNARTVLALQRRDLDEWTHWEDGLLEILADAPGNALSLNHLTFFYQGMGRCGDSWNLNERALEAEPFNPIPQHRRAIKHWIFGRTGEADKVADQSLRLWPRNANAWNARMIIFAFTGRADAGLALLDDKAIRPVNLKPPSITSWRAALRAIASRSPADIATALDSFAKVAPLAPGLAANAIMTASYLGEVDAAYRFANGLFENRGDLVQRSRGTGIRDAYSSSAWGRTQFLFIPATAAFRNDDRFPELCRRMGHIAYWQKRGIWPDPFVRGALDPARLA